MEPGESLTACALREAEEETGLQVQLGRLVCIQSDPTHYALCRYPDGTLVHYCNHTFLAWTTETHLRPSEESLQVCWVRTDCLPVPFLLSHHWRLVQALAQYEGVVVQ
jgi:ADP-ribose pyrophosphatase YjhB (NUDIX family)